MFARIDAKHAGPHALGILVPHGAKTLVIVRPRALAWDLLPARWGGERDTSPQFCVFSRDEAASVARRLVAILEAAVQKGVNLLETFGDANAGRLQLWLHTEEFVWILCQRAPGEAYQPIIFGSTEEAIQAAEKIAAYIWPAADVKQEYYFNTQNFSQS
jgi:hypothetical protein